MLVGTRPEAVKMAPVVMALRARDAFECLLVSTGQHREMLKQALDTFDLAPDEDLAVMQQNQDLPGLTARLLTGLAEVFARRRPDAVLVQGDTTMVLAVKRNPDSAKAKILLAVYLEDLAATPDALAQARQLYTDAGACDLSDARTRVMLASRLGRLGDFAGAREHLKAVIAEDPHRPDVWQACAALVLAERSRQNALHTAKRALESLGPDHYAFLDTATELFAFGGDDAAVETCAKAIEEQEPDAPRLAFLKGLVAQAKGDVRGAIKHWKAATEAPEAPAWRWPAPTKRRANTRSPSANTARSPGDGPAASTRKRVWRATSRARGTSARPPATRQRPCGWPHITWARVCWTSTSEPGLLRASRTATGTLPRWRAKSRTCAHSTRTTTGSRCWRRAWPGGAATGSAPPGSCRRCSRRTARAWRAD